MPPITLEAAQSSLEAAQAKVEEARKVIDQLKAQSKPTLLKIHEAAIELQPGEHYAGAVLGENGKILHHLVLMAAKPTGRLDWKSATAWAAQVGGALPNRQEQALLFANCKPHLEGVWHWSSETHESDASYAWLCTFYYGDQTYGRKSAEGAAVAVRRFNA